MARGDGPDHAPEPLSRLLARSDAVTRELERARERLAEMAERYEADEPLVPVPRHDREGAAPLDAFAPPPADGAAAGRPADDQPGAQAATDERRQAEDRLRELWVIPEASVPDDEAPDREVRDEKGPRDHDIAMLQEAARRRLSDER